MLASYYTDISSFDTISLDGGGPRERLAREPQQRSSLLEIKTSCLQYNRHENKRRKILITLRQRSLWEICFSL